MVKRPVTRGRSNIIRKGRGGETSFHSKFSRSTINAGKNQRPMRLRVNGSVGPQKRP